MYKAFFSVRLVCVDSCGEHFDYHFPCWRVASGAMEVDGGFLQCFAFSATSLESCPLPSAILVLCPCPRAPCHSHAAAAAA